MIVILLGASILAHAHVGAPIDAIDVQPVLTDGRALEASIGLVWTEDGSDWRWVCHEAITTPDALITPRYAIAGRRWLATVPRLEQSRTEADAVYWTDDGCTWTAAEGLSGHEVPEVALDGSGTIALAVTADEDAPSNAILRSTDGGQSFASVRSVDGQVLTSVVMAEGTAGTALVGGIDTDGQGWLHWSDDQGITWSSTQVIEGEVLAMALHPTNTDVGYAVVNGVGVETLLWSTDHGASVEVLLEPEGTISDVEVDGNGAAWVAFGGNAFLHAEDGANFGLVTAAPPGLGLALHGDTVLLATRFEMVNNALAEGSLDDGFEPRFSFVSLDGALECPAGTRGADVCEPLFPLLLESLGLGGTDTGTLDTGADPEPDPTPDSGEAPDGETDASSGSKDTGGCGSQALLWLLPLGLAARRRPQHT